MNRGAQRLRKAVPRGEQTKLAGKLGVDPAAVCKWLKGKHVPAARFRAKIEDEYGIGWRLWDQEVAP
jgi:transcriptional regulator with XRE-family HTH domain